MKPQPLSDHDRRVLETQLGRPPRGAVFVAARCPYGEVEVVATAPLLDGEEPFPTLYWLTCPLLKSEVGRLEAGEMRELLRAGMQDEGFARELAEAEAAYLEERRELARSLGMEQAEELFEGRNGVAGGPAGNLKCLHSHFAHWLAQGGNPVGRKMAARMSPVQKERCKGTCPTALTGDAS
jgi:hypothetical protein